MNPPTCTESEMTSRVTCLGGREARRTNPAVDCHAGCTTGKLTRFENIFHDLRLHRLRLAVVDCEAFHVHRQGAKGDIFGNEHASSRTFKLEVTRSLVISVSALPTKDTTVLALQQTVYLFCTTRWLINEASIEFTSLGVQQRDGLRAYHGAP